MKHIRYVLALYLIPGGMPHVIRYPGDTLTLRKQAQRAHRRSSMAHVVTLNLPDDLATRAEAFAVRTHQRLEDVLLDWLSRGASNVPIAALTDDEVLALSDLQMDEQDQRALSDLLARQREGTLDAEGRKRLDDLMTAYRSGMVRKAETLKVAVERGLLPPLDAPQTTQADE